MSLHPGDRVEWTRVDGHKIQGTVSHREARNDIRFVIACETRLGVVDVALPESKLVLL